MMTADDQQKLRELRPIMASSLAGVVCCIVGFLLFMAWTLHPKKEWTAILWGWAFVLNATLFHLDSDWRMKDFKRKWEPSDDGKHDGQHDGQH